jgi:preprotein translocase subunit SecG
MLNGFRTEGRKAEMGRQRGEDRGSSGPKRITFFFFFLFVLLSVFLTLSQSKIQQEESWTGQRYFQTEKREEETNKN